MTQEQNLFGLGNTLRSLSMEYGRGDPLSFPRGVVVLDVRLMACITTTFSFSNFVTPVTRLVLLPSKT